MQNIHILKSPDLEIQVSLSPFQVTITFVISFVFSLKGFSVKHFSDTVEYDVMGFLEKNRDTVSKELVNVLRSSKMSLCKQLMEMEEIDTLSADAAKTHTLGGRVVISAARKQV